MIGRGAFDTTTPGSGLKVTVSAKASCTGPRVNTSTPCWAFAGTTGAALVLCTQIAVLMAANAVTTHHWMSEQVFVVLVAIGQLTPGPVFSTIAAIGYYADGIRGAAIGAVLAFLPSYLMVVFLAPKLQRVRERSDVTMFFSGALPASTGLILGTTPFFVTSIHQWLGAVFAVAGLVALFSKKVPVVLVLLVGVTAGLTLAHP